MTASMDKKAEEVSKKKKPKGPFRTGLIVALVFIFTASFLYFKFLFDRNLKSALEWTLTHIHGAEVNVEDLTTSFTRADLLIENIQFTNKDEPKLNILQIDSIRFKLLWDAILRGKIVIDESSIKQIAIYTERSYPGEILPEDENSLIEKSETLKEGRDNALDVAKEKFNQNALGDIASLLDGTDTKTYTEEIKDNLATEKKIKEIENLVDEKEEHWDKRIKSLPKEEEFKKLISDVKDTKLDKNPLKAAKQIKELSQTIKEGKNKVKQYSDAVSQLEKDIKIVETQYKSIDDVIEQDVKSLESRYDIPDIDPTSLSLAFFSKMIGQNEEEVRKYVGLAKEYLPEKETVQKNKEEKIKPRERGEGVDIKFPVTTGYPKFWLKKSIISSKSSKGPGFSGDLSGMVTHITDDPQYIKKPATFELSGNFPKQGFSGVKLRIQANHHTKKEFETFAFSIGNYPIKGVKLSDSSKVKITMSKADSNFNLQGQHTEGHVTLNLRNNFNSTKFKVESSSDKTKSILEDILNDINSSYLSAKASGKASDLKWDISSNIGQQIAQSFRGLLKEKIAKLKRKLRESVESKVEKQKNKLKEKINKLENQYKSKINAEKEKANQKIKELTDSVSNKSKSQLKNKTNKALEKSKKKLKKLFKF